MPFFEILTELKAQNMFKLQEILNKTILKLRFY
jgi:hypothetical protein